MKNLKISCSIPSPIIQFIFSYCSMNMTLVIVLRPSHSGSSTKLSIRFAEKVSIVLILQMWNGRHKARITCLIPPVVGHLL